MVINTDADIIPSVVLHLIAGGEHAEKTEDLAAGAVVEQAPAVFLPLPYQFTGRDGDLVG